jgi:hypothetical protein
MNKRNMAALLIAGLIAVGFVPAAQAQARVTFTATTGAPLASQTLTGLNPAGDVVTLTLGTFPTGKGLYVYQGVQGAMGARPTQINQASEQWVTTAMGGTAKPTDLISIKVDNGHAWGADCAHQVCGIAIEFDHASTADHSEDQFFPITFAAQSTTPAATTPVTSVTIIAQIDGKNLSATVPGSLPYETPKYVVVTTSDGSTPKLAISADPSGKTFCNVKDNLITALAGTNYCNLEIATANGKANFPFALTPGIQFVRTAPKTIKVGQVVSLSVKTNFGEGATYKVATNSTCKLAGNKISGKKVGTCMLSVKAPGTANYLALKGSISFEVSK